MSSKVIKDITQDLANAIVRGDTMVPVCSVGPLLEHIEELKPSEQYKHCNHHHELTDKHILVDFGDGEFVANKDGVPILEALNSLGIRTRTHHIEKGEHCFLTILLDNVDIEVVTVNEIHADRDKYNGKKELLIRWRAE